MTTPTEPLYIWAPRYLYSPSYIDTMPGRVGYPTKVTKETAELEERLARLEAGSKGRERAPDGPPRTICHGCDWKNVDPLLQK